MSKKKNPEETVRRRLYSLYDEQIVKLAELAKQASTTQSQYLRELIDVAYAEKIQMKKTNAGYYGQVG